MYVNECRIGDSQPVYGSNVEKQSWEIKCFYFRMSLGYFMIIFGGVVFAMFVIVPALIFFCPSFGIVTHLLHVYAMSYDVITDNQLISSIKPMLKEGHEIKYRKILYLNNIYNQYICYNCIRSNQLLFTHAFIMDIMDI